MTSFDVVPVLATVILLGTIATFILAVGAYFVYKVGSAKEVKKK